MNAVHNTKRNPRFVSSCFKGQRRLKKESLFVKKFYRARADIRRLSAPIWWGERHPDAIVETVQIAQGTVCLLDECDADINHWEHITDIQTNDEMAEEFFPREAAKPKEKKSLKVWVLVRKSDGKIHNTFLECPKVIVAVAHLWDIVELTKEYEVSSD